VGVLVAAVLVGISVWWARGDPAIDGRSSATGDRVDATVTAAAIGPCSYDPEAECNSVSARIASGPDEGTFATLEADVATRTLVAELAASDDIVLNDGGAEVDAAARYSCGPGVRSRSPGLSRTAASLAAVGTVAATAGMG
jgi:hypothetical protein